MNDLIELSDAELALVAAGGHGSPLAAGGHGSPLAGSSGHGLGLGRSVGAVQTNNSIIIEIAVALNITANRRLVGTKVATMAEETCGILSGDAVESGTERLLECLDRARSDAAQI